MGVFINDRSLNKLTNVLPHVKMSYSCNFVSRMDNSRSFSLSSSQNNINHIICPGDGGDFLLNLRDVKKKLTREYWLIIRKNFHNRESVMRE